MKTKLLNSFIGVMDERDEYQRQEIYKKLAFSGMILWYAIALLMFISLIIDTMHNTFSFITLALLVINMVYAVITFPSLRKEGLDGTDCASIEEYNQKRKQLKKSSIFSGIIWGMFMFIFMQYLLPYLRTGNIEINFWDVLTWGIGGLVFGLGMYLISKSKLKKHF